MYVYDGDPYVVGPLKIDTLELSEMFDSAPAHMEGKEAAGTMLHSALPFAIPFENPIFRVFHFITHTQTDSLI